MRVPTSALARFALLLSLLAVFGCPSDAPPDDDDAAADDDDDSAATDDDDDDSNPDDDDDSTPIDAPPSAPVVLAPPSTSVGVATSVTITAGLDPEGAQVNVQCTSADSNYDAVAYDDGLGAGGRVITASFTWSAVGSHDLFCTNFDAGGQPSLLQGQDTINVTDPTGFTLPMVLLPAGTFTMGCLAGRDDLNVGFGPYSDEYPSHPVTLTHSFWMAQTETTQAQFEALMGYNPSCFGPGGAGIDDGWDCLTDCGPNCPVETVSWHEATAFANEVSLTEALPACYACNSFGPSVSCTPLGDPYQCAGYRLPTEAEWEYAARGGEAWEYAGSANIGQVAWYSANSGSTTHPSGQLLPNGFGLFDMSGNVWEWAQDLYSSTYYASSPTVDPPGAASGSDRVIRGGAWDGSGSGFRAAFRYEDTPGRRGNYLGFRLSRSIP